MQTKISTSTCKYAHEKTRNNATTQQLNNPRNVKNAQPQKSSNKNYKRVIVKLVRLLSARPAAVSLVAIGSVLPNPL
jgi:hypothetical protein